MDQERKRFIKKVQKKVLELTSILGLLTNDILKLVNEIEGIKINNNTEITINSELQFKYRTAIRVVVDSLLAGEYVIRELSKDMISWQNLDKKLLIAKKFHDEARLTFKIMAIAFGSPFEVAEDDEGWGKYEKTKDIRNRITHPMKLKDLKVSVEDYYRAAEAFEWFNKCLGKVQETQTIFPSLSKCPLLS